MWFVVPSLPQKSILMLAICCRISSKDYSRHPSTVACHTIHSKLRRKLIIYLMKAEQILVSKACGMLVCRSAQLACKHEKHHSGRTRNIEQQFCKKTKIFDGPAKYILDHTETWRRQWFFLKQTTRLNHCLQFLEQELIVYHVVFDLLLRGQRLHLPLKVRNTQHLSSWVSTHISSLGPLLILPSHHATAKLNHWQKPQPYSTSLHSFI